jgi:uncharacterized protein (TIGR03435 family)
MSLRMRSFLPARTALLLLAAALSASAQAASAQDPPATPLRFEVASIKPSKPGATLQDMHIEVPPGRMEALNITLYELISSLSGFSQKVEGGPKWAETDRYDIVAKSDRPISAQDRTLMALALLEERFKLVLHHEAKESSGLALLIGKAPPDLKPSKDGEKTQFLSDGHQIKCLSVNMFSLTAYLTQMLRLAVEDRTRLAGKFDFKLDLDRSPGEPFADRVRAAVEDFGFLFESKKVTKQISVIDHAERPTEN